MVFRHNVLRFDSSDGRVSHRTDTQRRVDLSRDSDFYTPGENDGPRDRRDRDGRDRDHLRDRERERDMRDREMQREREMEWERERDRDRSRGMGMNRAVPMGGGAAAGGGRAPWESRPMAERMRDGGRR